MRFLISLAHVAFLRRKGISTGKIFFSRAYCWLCAQGSLLEVLSGPHALPETELGPPTCKANCLSPCLMAPAPDHFLNAIKKKTVEHFSESVRKDNDKCVCLQAIK